VDATAPPVEETWNVSDLFEDDEAFAAEQRAFRDDTLPHVDAARGRLLESATTFADTLDRVDQARQQLERLYTYASLKSDEDTRNATYQAMRQEMGLLATQLSEKLAFMNPEILAGDPETLQGFLDKEPRLAPYRFHINDLLRQRKHVLATGEERIMAEAGLMRGQSSSTYRLLADAELPRPEVTLDDGKKRSTAPIDCACSPPTSPPTRISAARWATTSTRHSRNISSIPVCATTRAASPLRSTQTTCPSPSTAT
jgi:oligoendopeptidase F